MKLFKRAFKQEVKCNIDLKITSLTLEVDQPLILRLRWTRGPQQDVSETFEVSRAANTYELNFNFARGSSFYRDSKNVFERKESKIELIASSVGHE